MDEALFARLAALLPSGPVVLANIVDTRGATPRKRGSRMLITPQSSEFSVGGGMAEARVIAVARDLFGDSVTDTEIALQIDLNGLAGAAGICGGNMRISLRRWHGAADLQRAIQISRTLQVGGRVVLTGTDLGDARASDTASPNVRLLIVGAGHCGLALYELARYLGFDIWVHDTRAACFGNGQFSTAQQRCGDVAQLGDALDTQRDVYAVLLNRDFHADVAALDMLCRKPPTLLAMMGSRRRIAEVLLALPQHGEALRELIAPVGLEIGAQTPHEIAVSILAQLIERRSRTLMQCASNN